MFGLHSSEVLQRWDVSQTPSSKGNEVSQAIASPTEVQQSPSMNIIWTPNQTTVNKYGSSNTYQCKLKTGETGDFLFKF